MKSLNIGTDAAGRPFALPIDLTTQTMAILAKRGVGKSYTASVVAEELMVGNQQVAVLDPTGAWWGLKSSADGNKEGFPIVVFGGEHSDIGALDEGAGEVVARALVEERFSAIIDLSIFRKGQARRFVTAFLETLYRLNREPLHLFVDEADDIAPQKPFGDEAAMVGALEDVIKRGRKKGIGCTLITQRPADLAKQVLTQCEMLVAMRLVHPRDIAAIREWVNVHADPKESADMMESLPSLPVGTAWFWSPGWGDIMARVKVRERKTFDSSATPKPGQTVRGPKVLAPVDRARLGQQIAAMVEKAKAEDPKELKRRLAELERRAATPTAPTVQTVEKEVPVLTESQAAVFGEIRDSVDRLAEDLKAAMAGLQTLREESMRIRAEIVGRSVPPARMSHRIARGVTPFAASTPPTRSSVKDSGDVLPKGERAVLTAAAQYMEGIDRSQATILTGYKRSSRDTYIQRLRERGYVETSGDTILATAEGIAALGDFEPLPTGDALAQWWLGRLPAGEKKILEMLLNAGRPVDREQLTIQTGYQRSSRDTYIQRLSSRKLVESTGPGTVQAARHLFN